MNKEIGPNSPSDASDGHARGGVVVHHSESFSGPLPPPEVLRRFDEVVPGAAERIIRMAEGQFAHRVDLEKRVIKSDIARSRWGQIFAFVIALVGLAVAAIVSIYGSQWAGSIIGGGTLVSLAGVFLYGSKGRSKERENKASGSIK